MAEAHIRADEGIVRGPHKEPASWPTRKPPIKGKLGPRFNAASVLERYLQGEEIAEIAETLGVHPKALNYHLLKPEIREAWKQAQVAVSHADYLEAKSVIKSSPDALSLARARDLAKTCQWDLERLENRLFGQKQEVTVTNILQIETVLDGQVDKLLARVVAPITHAAPLQGESVRVPTDDTPT